MNAKINIANLAVRITDWEKAIKSAKPSYWCQECSLSIIFLLPSQACAQRFTRALTQRPLYIVDIAPSPSLSFASGHKLYGLHHLSWGITRQVLQLRHIFKSFAELSLHINHCDFLTFSACNFCYFHLTAFLYSWHVYFYMNSPAFLCILFSLFSSISSQCFVLILLLHSQILFHSTFILQLTLLSVVPCHILLHQPHFSLHSPTLCLKPINTNIETSWELFQKQKIRIYTWKQHDSSRCHWNNI